MKAVTVIQHLHTYIHTYHTYIHTYIHTYACIHTDIVHMYYVVEGDSDNLGEVVLDDMADAVDKLCPLPFDA